MVAHLLLHLDACSCSMYCHYRPLRGHAGSRARFSLRHLLTIKLSKKLVESVRLAYGELPENSRWILFGSPRWPSGDKKIGLENIFIFTERPVRMLRLIKVDGLSFRLRIRSGRPRTMCRLLAWIFCWITERDCDDSYFIFM